MSDITLTTEVIERLGRQYVAVKLGDHEIITQPLLGYGPSAALTIDEARDLAVGTLARALHDLCDGQYVRQW